MSTTSEKFRTEDLAYKARRAELPGKLGIPDLWTIVDQFGLYAGIQTIGTRLAVFEIMKKCLHVPGHIAEFGCWHGANLMFMAKVMQLLQPNTYKHIYGFDSFEGLQTFSPEDKAGTNWNGAYRGNEQVLREMIAFFGMDEWVHIVKGNALETIPRFEKENKHVMFSLAYIDFDLYQPCKVALEFVGRRMSPGGVIVLDEALTQNFPGEGQALLEFLADTGAGDYAMHCVEFARQPSVYLVKR